MMHPMNNVFLISCCAKKLPYAAPARQLYCSPNFKKELLIADLLKPDATFVISAEHHLVELDYVLEPYNKTLNDMTEEENRLWAMQVISELKKRFNFETTHFAIYASKAYYKNLIPHMPHYHLPLEHVNMYQKSKVLDDIIKSILAIKRSENENLEDNEND